MHTHEPVYDNLTHRYHCLTCGEVLDSCPRCGSTDKAERREVYSDSSHYDFRECGDHWHRGE